MTQELERAPTAGLKRPAGRSRRRKRSPPRRRQPTTCASGSTSASSCASPTASSGATAAPRSGRRCSTRASRDGHLHPAQSGEAARLLPAPLQSQRRRPQRAPHVHLHARRRTWPGRPTTGWRPRQAYAKLRALFDGCMRGRTMYVVPFVMGPIGSPLAKVGVQLTDSLYVAVSHGHHDAHGRRRVAAARRRRRVHALPAQPRRRAIPTAATSATSRSTTRSGRFGSGYGGNALLGQEVPGAAHRQLPRPAAGLDGRAHAAHGRRPSPTGEKTYVAAAFPSACGKTNFAMLIPPEKYQKQGWKITTVGDDIVWMWVDEKTGRLRAINPEAGYFGVVPGHELTRPIPTRWRRWRTTRSSPTSRCCPMATSGGKARPTSRRPECIDWTGQEWTPEIGETGEGRASEQPLHRADDEQSGARPGRGRSRRRAGRARSSSAAGAARRSRWSSRRSTGCTASTSARRSARRPPPPPPGRSASSAATRWPCSRSLATTSATTSSTGSACARR